MINITTTTTLISTQQRMSLYLLQQKFLALSRSYRICYGMQEPKSQTILHKSLHPFQDTKFSITRCAFGIRSVIVLLIALSSPILSGSCLPVLASSTNRSYGRNRNISVGMVLIGTLPSFSKEVLSLNRMERGTSDNQIWGCCVSHRIRLACRQSLR